MNPAAECSLRILLVEDSHDFVFLLSSIFESMGHKCIPVYDGAEGVRAAKEVNPDVIFCDIGLPQMDGFEVAKRIRKDNCGVPIVALSGYAGQRDFERAAESGFDFHIAKPADMAEIKKILDKVQKAI